VNAVTTIAISQFVQRVRPPAFPAETPDFFSMIDQQARMVVNLATTASEVLQGKESAHSLRLLDLEQRREELQRRNRAAVDSMLGRRSGVEEIYWTMETLDRASAGLFRTARSFHQLLPGPDEIAGQMLGVIQKAAESLQHGYARLANGSPAAEFDADAAMESRHLLGHYRALTLWGAADQAPAPSQHQSLVPAEKTGSLRRMFWLYELYDHLDGVVQELSGAGAILKGWSRQLSAGLYDRNARVGSVCSPISPPLVTS
jgi:hypothetical protein